ncbi:MAG: dihydropteroate synthase [Gammaproteobacteria bacterium]|jgi:dihydropteroate synthase|nr:dihydropteroate synthase [Gammaproteobacteria bacterium]
MSRLAPLLDKSRPLVMGILNVTPDSFSDGGKFFSPSTAIEQAGRMIADGADIIDVGGESTRPGAQEVSADEELERVVPVIGGIREHSEICISVDTSSPEVMLESSLLGIDILNDVRALRRSGAMEAAARTGLPVCLMHMKGEPGTMQVAPCYEDIMQEINGFFMERIAACGKAGIGVDRLVLDPGFGFGKTPEHNLQLVNKLGCFKGHGLPLLVGLSRKSTITRITDNPLVGSIAGALLAVARGANIIRVHDVAETVSALNVASAINAESLEAEK